MMQLGNSYLYPYDLASASLEGYSRQFLSILDCRLSLQTNQVYQSVWAEQPHPNTNCDSIWENSDNLRVTQQGLQFALRCQYSIGQRWLGPKPTGILLAARPTRETLGSEPLPVPKHRSKIQDLVGHNAAHESGYFCASV